VLSVTSFSALRPYLHTYLRRTHRKKYRRAQKIIVVSSPSMSAPPPRPILAATMNHYRKLCNPAMAASLLLSHCMNERKDNSAKCEGLSPTPVKVPSGLLFLGTGSS
jgi:hypothetical protein